MTLGHEPMNQSFRMYPVKGMIKDIELPCIITDYAQICCYALFQKPPDQHTFCQNALWPAPLSGHNRYSKPVGVHPVRIHTIGSFRGDRSQGQSLQWQQWLFVRGWRPLFFRHSNLHIILRFFIRNSFLVLRCCGGYLEESNTQWSWTDATQLSGHPIWQDNRKVKKPVLFYPLFDNIR